MTGSMRRVPRALLPALLGVLVLSLIAAGAVVLSSSTKTATAYFASTKSIYPGDKVRVLGIEVGEIDAITQESDRVRVDFHYDADVRLPADVHAAILSPTLVATRFIQLEPVYTGGPELADAGVIPIERTVSPVEFDELKQQLADLSDGLGPSAGDPEGALNRALAVIDANGRGQGRNFNDMITALSEAAQTVADGREDLFGTVRNLAAFSTVLRAVDADIAEFNGRLAEVAAVLDQNSEGVRTLVPLAEDAARKAEMLLDRYAEPLRRTIDNANSVTGNLARQRDELANILHLGPNAVTNFLNIFSPRTGDLNGILVVDQLAGAGGRGDVFCAALSAPLPGEQAEMQRRCVETLGPLLALLRQPPPPIGVGLPEVPGGGPGREDIELERIEPEKPVDSQLPPAGTDVGLDSLLDGLGVK